MGEGPVPRLPPEGKVAATVAFVVAVVATPREAVWAFGLHLALVLVVLAVARLRPLAVARRMRVEVPFLVFAVLLPVVGVGPRVEVAGLSLSREGLWGGWNLAAKGTLGVLAAVVLSSTTPAADLLRGAERLRAPRVMVAIAGAMVRYLDVVAAEAGRMRVARISRADDPRWIWQARATAATAGTLFVRSYERGERVHLAMLARGYDGSLPAVRGRAARPAQWAATVVVPAVAVAVAVAARTT